MKYLFLSAALLLPSCTTTAQEAPDSLVLDDAPTAVEMAQAEAQIEAKTDVLNTAASVDPKFARLQRFEAWKADFVQRAVAKGYPRDLLNSTVARATLNEKALDRNANQPEFTRPVWSYIQSAASADRVTRGQAELSEHTATFDDIERVYGVPREILGAIWGLETSYGRIMGNFDIIDSLSTFAFEGRRSEFGEQQLFAALDLLRSGAVQQNQLVGAWAGAMGMTQFIPTTFRDYAVDFDQNGNTDLWGSEADALASAANYLTRSGWKVGQPVLSEVVLPNGFDYGLAETNRKPVSDWVAMGAKPANGLAFSPAALELEAKLLTPAGHRGPKFLTYRNFDAIKRYNNSTSYVMGIASLGEALRGETMIRNPWPEGDQPLSIDDKTAMQERLTALGYDTKGIDGMIGPATRKAIRAWQVANGLPADGYVEQTLFRRIMNN